MISQIYYLSLSRSLLSYAHFIQAHFRLIESTGDKLAIVRMFHYPYIFHPCLFVKKVYEAVFKFGDFELP